MSNPNVHECPASKVWDEKADEKHGTGEQSLVSNKPGDNRYPAYVTVVGTRLEIHSEFYVDVLHCPFCGSKLLRFV